LDELDSELLFTLKDGIPLTKEPFAAVATHLGVAPEEVIKRLKKLLAEKVIRKFGLFVWKRRLGISANALVVWRVPPSRVPRVAKFFSKSSQVTHCYERRTTPNWKYNVYTMIHGRNRESVNEFVKAMADETEVDDYLVLFSKREFVRRSIGLIRD
jgi:DNA-binding Lrp family transcriptional regulator